ncbi:MAG TPA: metal-dependent transcriptional regulator [Anaerolineales bacterium]|nr:metal-dependent transcriptional regulator [Anaerolineales bacterium]
MKPGGHSEAVEMYLKSLAVLGGARQPVAVAQLAEKLQVTTVSANEMLHRLSRDGLVTHQPYRGFQLTEAGRETAWDVIRRERLWERFLVDQLKLDPARAIGWACQLEHATAPEVIEALDGFLQYPATCPQGQPIPRSADDAVHGEGRMLSEAEIGERVRLTAFDDEDPEVLTYLQRQGLAIGQVVSVVEMGPRRSPLTLRLENGQAVIGRDLALTIQTERVA